MLHISDTLIHARLATGSSARHDYYEGIMMSTRLSVNINDETEAALRELAARRGTSVTEIVRRAVSVYKLVEDEVGQNKKTLQLVDSKNDVVTTLAMIG